MAHEETFETVTGCRIRIMRKGQGQPLLFLHGASGAANWLPFMDMLAQNYDVIVPEHPGFGAPRRLNGSTTSAIWLTFIAT